MRRAPTRPARAPSGTGPGLGLQGELRQGSLAFPAEHLPSPEAAERPREENPKEPRTPPHALLKAPLPWPGGPQGRSGTGQEYLEKANIPGQGSGAGGGS